MNKKKLTKIVIKRGNCGFLYSLPMDFNSPCFSQMLNMFRSGTTVQVKICTESVLYEMHRDKYNNLIYREYEKQTSRPQARSQNVLD